MTDPPRLFVPDDEPCQLCDGTGKRGPVYEEQPCSACGGTGHQKDVYDPATAPLPEGL